MLANSPTDCFLLHALALEYAKKGELPKAIGYFQRALTNDENYVGSYYHLAKALELSGDVAQATAVYEKGIQIARSMKDLHAANELQMALDELVL